MDVGFSSNRGTTGSSRLLTSIFPSLSLSLCLSRSLASYANRLCPVVKTKRRGSEREEETKERFEPPGNNPSPLSLFLSIVLAVVLRFFFFFFFFFFSRSSRPTLLLLYATSTTPCNIYEIGDLSPNRPLLVSRSLRTRPPLPPWRGRGTKSFHGFLRKHGRDTPLRASITTVTPANSLSLHEIQLALILITL